MSNTADFLSLYEAVVRREGWRRVISPLALVDAWEYFVDRGSECYGWSIYEYENDISVRDLLETVLNESTLQGFAELKRIRDRVSAIDDRFRQISRPAGDTTDPRWWRNVVLRRGAPEYASDVLSRYGIEIEQCE